MSKQRFSNPLSLPRMSPNVSRHLTESHVTLFCPYRSLCPSFLPSSSSFSILCLRFRYHQDSFRHSKFLLLYTFANSGDPARFLFPITFFPRSMLLRISRDPPIFLFVIELNFRLLLFFYFLLFYILPSSFFPLSLVFGFGFVIFFALSQLISVLFHFFPFLDVLSCVFRFDMSLLFSRPFPFIFFSHLPLPHLSNPLFRARSLCLSLFFTHHSRPPQPLPLLRFIPLLLSNHLL